MLIVAAAATAVAAPPLVAAADDDGRPVTAQVQTKTIRIFATNMVPRLRPGDRATFDLAAYGPGRPVAAGDIVIFRPPRTEAAADGSQCGRPRVPARGELCIQAADGPAPEPVRYISRVVALAGERIEVRRGRVIRNGRPETRRGLGVCWDVDSCTFRSAITVPAGHVWIMGDARGGSDDSRFYGAVPEAWVTGRLQRTVRAPRRR